MGEPEEGYPWRWSIYSWIKSNTVASTPITDLNNFAISLAQFLIALQRINTINGPIPELKSFAHPNALATYDTETRKAISLLKDKIDRETITKI